MSRGATTAFACWAAPGGQREKGRDLSSAHKPASKSARHLPAPASLSHLSQKSFHLLVHHRVQFLQVSVGQRAESGVPRLGSFERGDPDLEVAGFHPQVQTRRDGHQGQEGRARGYGAGATRAGGARGLRARLPGPSFPALLLAQHCDGVAGGRDASLPVPPAPVFTRNRTWFANFSPGARTTSWLSEELDAETEVHTGPSKRGPRSALLSSPRLVVRGKKRTPGPEAAGWKKNIRNQMQLLGLP